MKADRADFTLSSSPGAYILHLRLPQTCHLHIGSLGTLLFPAGEYLYTGSAFGPGGLRARLGRHLSRASKLHWHIDRLRATAELSGFCCYELPSADREIALAPIRLECRWSQRLASLPGARIPVLGFGSSDCRAGCPAHLVAFPLANRSLLADFYASGALVVEGIHSSILIHSLRSQVT